MEGVGAAHPRRLASARAIGVRMRRRKATIGVRGGLTFRPNQSGRGRRVGPGRHWRARRPRAGFVSSELCARVLVVGAMESGLLPRLARRLGVSEPDVLRKAEEHLRLSRLKCGGLSARTTETSRAVMCLDLAASRRSCPLDRAYAAKLSGVNQKTYQSCLKSFECLLGLNSSVGIQDLAVQFSCTEAVNLAAQMLQSPRETLFSNKEFCQHCSPSAMSPAFHRHSKQTSTCPGRCSPPPPCSRRASKCVCASRTVRPGPASVAQWLNVNL
ncbi:origin recognition complex subunit 6 isoform X3 [Myotis myotis]|uniref:origin recognition complex subunit 6 isoform X3 n=1 Tax=Myotis myotis TaxID=51298 RepID=UPI00174B06DB|nr:origin recognition complex subunit 6 isoform X3 [Myotis myotis]